MEDDLKLQDFDQWVKIFILKHEGGNLSKGSKILGHPIGYSCLVLDQVYFTVWLTVQAVSCFHSSAISDYKTVFLLVKRRNNAKKKKNLFLKSSEVSSVAYAYTIQKLHSFYWVKLSLVCKGCRRLLSYTILFTTIISYPSLISYKTRQTPWM